MESCEKPFFKSVHDRICVTECMAGEYGYESDVEVICKNCSENCTKCQNEDTCLECKNPYYLKTITSNNINMTNCTICGLLERKIGPPQTGNKNFKTCADNNKYCFA